MADGNRSWCTLDEGTPGVPVDTIPWPTIEDDREDDPRCHGFHGALHRVAGILRLCG